MLQELTIHNLALIEKLTINFTTGFTSLTGETGAGKSILLDALGLTLGSRADSSLVRYGTAKADVFAYFDISQLSFVQDWLKQHDLSDEDNCLLRRTLTAEGRSKAYINGLPVPASQLKSLSELLINIHGQHEHQSLLNANKQLELLDSYAQHNALIQKYRKNYQEWSKLKQDYQKLLASQEESQSKIDLLEFQLDEFNKLSPVAEEFSTLSKEQKTLSHANEIKVASQVAYSFIDGGSGVTDYLNSAIYEIEKIVSYQPQLNIVVEQLNSLLIDAQEIAADLQQQNNQVELDPQRLTQVDDRLAEIFNIAKKYHLDPEKLVKKHLLIAEELTELNSAVKSLASFKDNIDKSWQVLMQTGQDLSKSRHKTAKTLSKTITESMSSLGMPNGLFAVAVSAADKPNQTGMDTIELQVTANQGQPLQALSKVASGGELSRISLAIQVACAAVASLPTLIFDEVDVGIGGGIAEVVGVKMQALGLHHQILSITHLPQVAAFGHQQLLIEKTSDDKKTNTNVKELLFDDRIKELARMLGGKNITQQSLQHAKEMLIYAQKTA